MEIGTEPTELDQIVFFHLAWPLSEIAIIYFRKVFL